jgi:hypothetical protein
MKILAKCEDSISEDALLIGLVLAILLGLVAWRVYVWRKPLLRVGLPAVLLWLATQFPMLTTLLENLL